MSKVTFAVMTDLHYEHIPDGDWRLRDFLRRAVSEKADFIIQLGDFCRPTQENKRLLRLLDTAEIPVYHLLGNHDMDEYAKGDMLNWLGLKKSYYAFTCGGVRFIVLDANFIRREGRIIDYSRADHRIHKGEYPHIPQEELAWLEKELTQSAGPAVIFSHHSLESNFRNRGVSNRGAVQALINRCRKKGKPVLCCINGHDHSDSLEMLEDVYYLTVNSISYKWLEFRTLGKEEEVKSRYPELEDIILYDKPLSCTMTIHDNDDIEVHGIKGDFQYQFSPQAFGIDRWDSRPVNSGIENRILRSRQTAGNIRKRENCTNRIEPSLKEYVARSILPLYENFDEAHRLEHARAVIENSLQIAAEHPVDGNMVYVIAAYHDIGLAGGRADHEKRSADLLRRDGELRRWFTEEQIGIMAEAAEDHRASSRHAPRSIYGKIVAEADRDIEYSKILLRCIQYSLRHYPEYDERRHYERTYSHMREKYGEEGYLKLWLDTRRNRENLAGLRQKLRQQDRFRQDFHAVFRQLTAETESGGKDEGGEPVFPENTAQ